MKNHPFAILQGILLRFVLSGILLLSFAAGSPSAVYARGGAPQKASPASPETSDLSALSHDDDCDDDERSAGHTGESDSEECRPRVQVTDVWTADGSLGPKTAFTPGEPIQWVITLNNSKRAPVSVQLKYVVKDPAGTVILRLETTVTAGPGESTWERSGTVPDTAGSYSFTGTARYLDSTSRKTVSYEVGAACHTLSVSSDPAAGGIVTVDPAPDCNNATQYTPGTVVSLTAAASTGYVFSGWSGALTGSTNPATLILTEDASLTANFAAFAGLGAGTHDDTDPAWTYTGSWTTVSNAGYYNGTSHQSAAAGNDATVTIDGSRFTLFYTGAADHGSLDVYVDDVKIDTIDQSGTATEFQQAWTSPDLDPGVHTLKLVHVSGTLVDIDALQICGAGIATPGNVYDDTDCVWTYSGSWSTWTGTGPYNNTMHYTNATGATASFTFQAPARFILFFQGFPNRSNVLISVDGAAPVAVNAYTPANVWQQSYTSELYSDTGTHTVTLSTPGDGHYIDVDVLKFCGAPVAVQGNTYDDTDCLWTYSGSWSTWSGTGPYNNTMHYTNAAGATASFTFQAPARFILFFQGYPNRSNVLISVDGGTPLAVNAYTPANVWQQSYASAMYSDTGTHTVTLSTPGDGHYIDVDAVQIAGPPAALGPGDYDDTDPGITYSGSWSTWTGTGPYNNTMHYTNATGATASFTFQAPARFILLFQGYPNRSNVLVSVDSGMPLAVNTYTPVNVWQQSYTSELYSDTGIHTVTLTTPGDGHYIDVDAILIE